MRNQNYKKIFQKLLPIIFVNICFLAEIAILIGVFFQVLLRDTITLNYWILGSWCGAVMLAILSYFGFTKIFIGMLKADVNNNKKLQQNNFIVHDLLEDFTNAGYIFYNNEQQIVYMSKFAENNFGTEMHGKSIRELAPEISPYRDQDQKVSLRKNQKHFKLIFLANYKVILIKDYTVFEKAAQLINNNVLAVVIYSLNNLTTALELMTEQEKSDYLYQSTAGIMALSKKYNMFLVKPAPNQFLVITNQLIINKILFNNEFKRVFVDFNESQINNKIMVQLSIASAFGLNNLNVLYEEALRNLGICSQRGGNQAIIRNCATKENITISGDHIKVEASPIINIKSFASTLKFKINQAKNIIIMGHKNLDFDCIGAGLGLIELCKMYGKQAKIIFDDQSASEEYTKIIAKHFSQKSFKEVFIINKNVFQSAFYNPAKTLLLVIDVSNHKLFENRKLFRKTKHFHVIDHHYLPIENADNQKNYFIDSNMSSTCEIIITLLNLEIEKHRTVVKLLPIVPTFLYMGMYIDTNDFKKQTTSATFTAAALLKNWGLDQANVNSILQINKTSFKRIVNLKSQFEEPIGNVLFCCDSDASQIYQKHEIAITCDELLLRRNSILSAAIAYVGENEISASLRSSSKKINVQQIAEKCGGGGSKNSAAIVMKHTTPTQLKKRIIAILKNEVIINSQLI